MSQKSTNPSPLYKKTFPPTKAEQNQTQRQEKMADASASTAPDQQLANLLLDEVTGEKVSKSELKRRQKQRQKEDEKKQKAAAAPPKPAKKESGEAEEKDLNPNVKTFQLT